MSKLIGGPSTISTVFSPVFGGTTATGVPAAGVAPFETGFLHCEHVPVALANAQSIGAPQFAHTAMPTIVCAEPRRVHSLLFVAQRFRPE